MCAGADREDGITGEWGGQGSQPSMRALGSEREFLTKSGSSEHLEKQKTTWYLRGPKAAITTLGDHPAQKPAARERVWVSVKQALVWGRVTRKLVMLSLTEA